MVLRFLCPNGHKIHCPDNRAGKAAKCPKCGVKFQIPEVSSVELGGSGSLLALGGDSGPAVSVGGTGQTAQPEEQIEFLCPNGHPLHGPASMQGRPGQCPECGAKFRVPSYDEDEDEELREREEQIEEPEAEVEAVAESGAMAEVLIEGADQPQEEPLQDRAALPGVLPAEESRLVGPIPPARLFAKLWAERSNGAEVELHLSGGETLTPDRFAETLSQGTYGVFAIPNPDQTHTLMAVAWAAIQRVVVRGVKQLPDEMGGGQ